MTETKYGTAWRRQKRREQWAAKAASAVLCPAMLGRRHACKTPLQSRFVNGETVPFCPTCDLKARGVCIECKGAPVYGTVGKALRCALCSKLAKQEQCNRFKTKFRKTVNGKARQYARDHSEERREYKRLLRKLKPQRMAQLKKESYERNREKVLAYHRAYNAARLEQKREIERLRALGQLPPRTCLTCETVLTGRAKRCEPCKTADRRAAREALEQRMERAA